MTTFATHAKLATIGTLALIACSFPAFSHAATPTETSSIQSQYQLLMERFDSLKQRKESTSTSTKPKHDKASTTVDRTCMAAAVNTREESLASAWSDFADSITTSLTERKDTLAAAWNASESGSRDAIKKAWENWRSDKKAAHTELRNDRKSAWDTFKKTAKESCKITTPKDEGLEKSSSDSIAL